MPLRCARISFCGRPVCEIGISGRINSHSLSGKFITTGFHACHFFLPLSYHLFVSFSCTLRYFLLFRYILGKRWKKAQLDAGLPTKTYCNRGAASIDLENLFETAPAFGACFIALFLFQRWSIQTPLLALFRAAIHWLSSLSCIYAINIHITENRKPHRTNMGCLFNDFNYAAGYFAPNNILRCIMI